MRKALAGALLSAALLSAAPLPREAHAQTSPDARPDVILIVTDDQRWDTLDVMPTLLGELAGHGVVFEQAVVSNPLCCPSRTSILTGNLSHTTLVYRNNPPFGRFEWFDDRSNLATWLDGAGYETAHIGKYLNGYQNGALTGYVPPGWDRWVAFVRPAYEDYDLTIDGRVVRDQMTYSTELLADEAVSFIEGASGPLFLSFAPYGPHEPWTPAPGDAGAPMPTRPQPPSLGEEDVSDKPAWVRGLPPLDAADRAELAAARAAADRSLLAVDRALGDIVDALERSGRLDDAILVFTSDQGLAYGEHRWTRKEAPYEEVIRVPLVVRFDPLTRAAPRIDGHLVANVDIAPTIAELVGISHPDTDGMSLVPLLRGTDPPWREAVLLEHMESANPIPTYCGLRTTQATYVRYETGEEELYDLRSDPFQMTNLVEAPDHAALLDDLRSRLRIACSPPPPGMEGGPASRAWLALALLTLVPVAESRRALRARRDPTRS